MKLDTVGGHDNAGFEVGQVAHLTLGGGAGGAGGMTQTTTTSEYQMNYERTHTQQVGIQTFHGSPFERWRFWLNLNLGLLSDWLSYAAQ